MINISTDTIKIFAPMIFLVIFFALLLNNSRTKNQMILIQGTEDDNFDINRYDIIIKGVERDNILKASEEILGLTESKHGMKVFYSLPYKLMSNVDGAYAREVKERLENLGVDIVIVKRNPNETEDNNYDVTITNVKRENKNKAIAVISKLTEYKHGADVFYNLPYKLKSNVDGTCAQIIKEELEKFGVDVIITKSEA